MIRWLELEHYNHRKIACVIQYIPHTPTNGLEFFVRTVILSQTPMSYGCSSPAYFKSMRFIFYIICTKKTTRNMRVNVYYISHSLHTRRVRV